MFEVRLKPGHPTGVYRRSGKEFTSSKPVRLQSLTREIASDKWLEVVDLDAERKKKEEELRAEAEKKRKEEEERRAREGSGQQS